MSTKIYDAYEISASSTHKLSRFIKNIKKMYLEKKVWPELNMLIFNKIEYFTQYLNVYNNFDNEDITRNVIKYAANYMCPKNRITPNDHSIHDAIKRVDSSSVLGTAYDVVEMEMRIAEADRTIMSVKYDFSASLALFTYKKRQFIMVFGRYFTQLFNDIIYANDSYYAAFRNEYKIKDYHYQNQTDQPDEITDAEWKERAHTWDVLLPSGVPSQDGLVINIANTENIISDMWRIRFDTKTYKDHIKDVFSHKLSSDMSVDKYAIRLVKDKAYSDYRIQINDDDNHMISNYMAFERQFNKDLKEENPNLMKKISYCKEKLRNIVFEFDDNIEDEIRHKSIIEFINNHSDKNHQIERINNI